MLLAWRRFFGAGAAASHRQHPVLAAFQAIRLQDNEWAKLYERLVKVKCPYDERTQSYVGKKRVIGRVAGQMTEAIYALLKRDAELVSKVPPGQEVPSLLLYDPEVHRQGQYRPLKAKPLPNIITVLHAQLPE